MNYQRIYTALIQSAITEPKLESYKELHHIIPLCMGGEDIKENRVKLTARQHYLAHWLLYKIHRTSALVHAWHSMSRYSTGQESRLINSHLFEYSKHARRKILSESSKGELNWFFGKTHTEETRKRLSEIHTGKIYKTPEQIEDWVNQVARQPKSIEHRKKIGRKGLVMLQNIITNEIIRVKRELIGIEYDESIWVNPKKLKPEQKFKCKYCEVVTIKGNLNRWHNEKCKMKGIQIEN